jgi:alpha-beta hydrolase superfamily lysophospholipase
MKLNKRRIFFWAKIIIIIYCAIGISLYYLQDKLLFHPQKLPADYIFKFDVPATEIQIPVNSEDTISMVKFFPVDSLPKGLLIYYHGNMENVEHYAGFAANFTRLGYEVWMPDYPGYGKSTGKLTEKKLYRLADLVQQMAAGKYKADSITIYGKSLGTGIAAYAASVSNCRQLILETPYSSIPDLFNSYAFIYPVSYMATYKIPTCEFLQDVKAPVTIFHGTRDRVIPYSCACKLKRCIKPADKFITIKDGEHNNLGGDKGYKDAMDSLLR